MFLHRRKSLETLCRSLKHNYKVAQARDHERGCYSSSTESNRVSYNSTLHELRDYEDKYYMESSQLIKLGFYEPKRSSVSRAEVSASPRPNLDIEPEQGSETCRQPQQGSHSLPTNSQRPSVRPETMPTSHNTLVETQTHVESNIPPSLKILKDLRKRHNECLERIESCKTLYVNNIEERRGATGLSPVRKDQLKEQANTVLLEITQWQEELERVQTGVDRAIHLYRKSRRPEKHANTMTTSSSAELLDHTFTPEVPETFYHSERESGATLDVNKGREPSEMPEYKAGKMPATDTKEDSDEFSDTPSKFLQGATDLLSCDEQLKAKPEVPETSYHMEKEPHRERLLVVATAAATTKYKATEEPADINEGHNPSGPPQYEAGEMPAADAKQDSAESSNASPELLPGATDIPSCNKQLNITQYKRLHNEASTSPARGACLPRSIMLLVLDSVARRHTWIKVRHRIGVG